MINARSETAATKPAFRAAFKKRRCLVPTDGYFEWVKEGKKKQPYWIRMQDEQPFLMAGLWESWRGESSRPKDADNASSAESSLEESSSLETFTILTTTSNELTQDIHDRMPVILYENDFDVWLNPEVQDADALCHLFDFDVWLNPEVQDADALCHLFEPYDSGRMKLDPVSDRVNSVRNDDEQCVEIQSRLF